MKTLLGNLDFLLTGVFGDTVFVLLESTNPKNKRFSAQKELYGYLRKTGRLDYSELANILTTAVKGE